MQDHVSAPTGLTRRGRRLSDHETEQRMLQAAVAMVTRDGLTVSLDHLSLEDVIRDADVSRSAVYRRWPYKDLFFSDLVKELAKNATPTITEDEVALMRQVLGEHLDWCDTPERRHRLVVELIRQLALFDFETIYGSPGWRTYLALHATVAGLANGELRDQIQEALGRSEEIRTARIAESWEQLTALLGYRLRPELGASFKTLATLLNATMSGLVITALSTPDIATHRVVGSPFEAAGKEEWSLAAIGIASMATAFLEPDPDLEWNAEDLAESQQALRSWTTPARDS